jgi:hypothetical protein
MRSTLILGIALAACASAPAIALAQDSAAATVRHHHRVHHYVHQRVEAEAIDPGATAQVPPAPAPTLFPHIASYPNGQSRPEWDCVGGDAGCTWEPNGWRN